MHKVSTVVIASLVVTLANFWIWKIIKVDFLLGLALILLSITLVQLLNTNFGKKIFLISLFLTFFISFKILTSGFDNNLTVLTPDQQKVLGERHGYFSISWGRLFQNKFVLRFYKDVYPYLNVYGSNIFASLSPNLYFFASHPREREKVEEFPMFPSIWVIPFLIGLVYFLNSSSKLIVGYLILTLLITGFVRQTYVLGPVLFFPIINLLITLGFLKIYLLKETIPFLKNNEL